MAKTVEQRFFEKFTIGDGCWEWTGAQTTSGYGHFWLGGSSKQAHRVAYEMFVGPIPEGLELDHLCRTTLCVRFDHVEPVTHRENVLRGMAPSSANARKTHCLNGHEFNAENTYFYSKERKCRICGEQRRQSSR